MAFEAYVDDSGVHDGRSRHLVLAALISPAEEWAQLSEAWTVYLAQPPRIKRFKMQEAAMLTGDFHRFDAPQRDAKLKGLAAIINRHVRFITSSLIDLEAHKRILAPAARKAINSPYYHCFHATIMGVAQVLWNGGCRERFEIFFDEQVIHGRRAKLWYPVIRMMAEHMYPRFAALYPVEPLFRTDDQLMPLQAADLFAWGTRYRADNMNTPHPFEWLMEEMPNVKLIDNGYNYTAELMIAMRAAQRRLRARPWTEAEQELGKRYQEATKGMPRPKPKRKK